MKTGLIVALVVCVAVALVIGGLAAGWVIAGRRVWSPSGGRMGGPSGVGMMGQWGVAQPCGATAAGCGASGPGVYRGGGSGGAQLTIDEAHEAVEQYVDGLRYRNLEIAELMEFERNYYAIVQEADTGIGAMELLVDKTTGAVGPEQGPNMMWNARYGMHGRGMMGGSSETNSLSEAEAVATAQRWLDANLPGTSPEEHADPFYGYYTIHTLRDGEIDGMLSVHGETGQVWYHNWHGDFVQMVELTEDSRS